jgi:hypothetical protein
VTYKDGSVSESTIVVDKTLLLGTKAYYLQNSISYAWDFVDDSLDDGVVIRQNYIHVPPLAVVQLRKFKYTRFCISVKNRPLV